MIAALPAHVSEALDADAHHDWGVLMADLAALRRPNRPATNDPLSLSFELMRREAAERGTSLHAPTDPQFVALRDSFMRRYQERKGLNRDAARKQFTRLLDELGEPPTAS